MILHQDTDTNNVVPLRPRIQWSIASAIDLAMEQHWRGLRKEPNARSWCRQLLETFPDKTLGTLTTENISTYIRLMQADGLKPWTVHARVCVVSTLYEVAVRNGYEGPVPTIPRPHVPKPLKWWLNPEMERELLEWLRKLGKDDMADYVLWTTETGLRVEETLRVHSGHFQGLLSTAPELTIPGTKTDEAQACVALSAGAAKVATSRYMAIGAGLSGSSAQRLFTMSYTQVMREWLNAREHFGWSESTATLKALRRSFARRLAVKGCPLPVMKQLLRHRDTQTTLNYLQLVGGGFTTEEQRKWL